MRQDKNGLGYFGDYLETLTRSHGRFTVFDDFLTMVVCALSMQRKEKEYLRTVRKYAKDEADLFCKAFAAVVMQMEKNPLNDPFGGYYEEYLSNERNGQFFTPQSVSDMMAQMLFCGDSAGKDNKVNDPCCGSGRLFLSAAKIDRKRYFVGTDIDLACCKMTLINMCLNSLQGEVYHMNTLSMQIWRKWFVFVDPTLKLPYIYEVENRDNSPGAAAEPAIREPPKEVFQEVEKIRLLKAGKVQNRGFVKFKVKA